MSALLDLIRSLPAALVNLVAGHMPTTAVCVALLPAAVVAVHVAIRAWQDRKANQ